MAGDIHVLPKGDLHEHKETRDCWCHPDCTQGPDDVAAVIVHHSADGRELVEQHGVN